MKRTTTVGPRRPAFLSLGGLSLLALVGASAATWLVAEPLARVDDDMQLVLDTYAGLRPRPLEILTPEEARLQPSAAAAVQTLLLRQGRDTSSQVLVPGVVSVDSTIPGPAGELPVRIFTPPGSGPFPVIVYFHGGGFVIANRTVYDAGARGLSLQANAVVVSVDYRLAPEHKFPAQHEDAFASYQWALANAAAINGDPTRVAGRRECRRQPGRRHRDSGA